MTAHAHLEYLWADCLAEDHHTNRATQRDMYMLFVCSMSEVMYCGAGIDRLCGGVKGFGIYIYIYSFVEKGGSKMSAGDIYCL